MIYANTRKEDGMGKKKLAGIILACTVVIIVVVVLFTFKPWVDGPRLPTPPTISNIQVSDITDSSAVITWITDEVAASQVEYGLTYSCDSMTPLDSQLVTNHSVTLGELDANTVYYFKVRSIDGEGYESVSDDDSFETLVWRDPTPPVSWQQSELGGVIPQNTLLTVAYSPYTMTSPVLVPIDKSLYIDPGVTINMNDKFIQVDGILQACGEPGNHIEFISSVGSNEGNRIVFSEESASWNEASGSGCVIEYADMIVHNTGYGAYGPIQIWQSSPKIAYCSIENLSSPGSAILVEGGAPIIEHNNLRADQIGIQATASNARIYDNVIEDAARGLILWGFSCEVLRNSIQNASTAIQMRMRYDIGGEPIEQGIIKYNSIINNFVRGISIEEVTNPDVLPVITENNIHDNGEYDVYLLETTVNIDCTYNWWGTTNAAEIAGRIYHQPNDFRLGLVAYEPLLTNPSPQSPQP